MKLQLFCAFIFYCLTSSSTRLVQKTTDRPRDLNESVKDTSSSAEEGPEIVHFYIGKVRTAREGENNETKISPKEYKNSMAVSKTPLVKRPIPKYKEIDSEEDDHPNQIKVKLPQKSIDTFVEDEDFSLNDYDFDVNHDEFVGRGKPLELQKEYKQVVAETEYKSVQKTKRNLVGYNDKNSISQKPLTKIVTKLNHKVKEYDDDYFQKKNYKFTQEEKPCNRNDDSSDESKTNNESFITSDRPAWSLSTFDKVGDKNSELKFLSFLPMFPQIPGGKLSGIYPKASYK